MLQIKVGFGCEIPTIFSCRLQIAGNKVSKEAFNILKRVLIHINFEKFSRENYKDLLIEQSNFSQIR